MLLAAMRFAILREVKWIVFPVPMVNKK